MLSNISHRIIFISRLILSLSYPVASPAVEVDAYPQLIEDTQLWYPVTTQDNDIPSFQQLQQQIQASAPIPSLMGKQGAFVTAIPITFSPNADPVEFVRIYANYLDIGVAYWQPSQQDVSPAMVFSPLLHHSPHLAHNQIVTLSEYNGERKGTLWIYIRAKQFAVPANITLFSQATFFHYQLTTNAITILSVGVMLTLALISLFVFIRTRYPVAIACTGYIGIHGIGWFAAAGTFGALFPFSTYNTTYWGMSLFPFAISAASQFTKYLFSCQTQHPTLCRIFNGLSALTLIAGIVLLAAPFPLIFVTCHIIATTWGILSIGTGIYMVRGGDYRAYYYLVGNLIYGVSLIYFVLSHVFPHARSFSAELMVMVALTLDCVCILLSMSSWLHRQQTEYLHNFTLSRTDPLIQIGNRLAFNETLNNEKHAFCLAFIDADGLKRINDKHGHNRGDAFLITCCELLQHRLSKHSALFRVGGDEFVWFYPIPITTNTENAREEMRKGILSAEKALLTSGWEETGLSFGIASSEEGASPSACLTLADERMYANKLAKKKAANAAFPPANTA